MENYIGIDLGGTNLRVAKIDNEFNIIDKIVVKSNPIEGVENLLNNMINAINNLKDKNTKRIGLSVPGAIDIDNKVIISAGNLNINNIKIGEIIENACNLDVYLNNDANAAGLGEALAGAGKDFSNVYYITWSTGVGGALIIDKKLITGKNCYTGEVGNLIIWPDDEYAHGVMNKGGLEGLTSGTYLAKKASECGFSNVKDMFDKYLSRDKIAIEVIEFVSDNMARAIANIIHVVEVDKFVMGGGVTINSGYILLPLVKEKINNYIVPSMKDKFIIESAKLGDDAGIIGAAYLVK